MRKTAFFGLAFLAIAFCSLVMPQQLFAQRGSKAQGQVIEVRLGSSVPRNSDWGRVLDRIASEWGRATNNEVRMRVLHDGVEGGDSKMLSSMSADNIQAGLFTSLGLTEICPAATTLSVPFMIRSEAELDMVLKDALPFLENQMSKSNFVVLTWSKAGWVNIFSKETVVVPDELRRQKMATSPESKSLNTVFKTMGFNMVETETADMGPRLANNVINSIYYTPAAVPPLGLHKYLKNMLEKPIAPFIGAIIINRVTWNKISPDRQRELLKITRDIAAEFDSKMPATVNYAVTTMKREGLKVNTITPAQEELWYAEVQKALPSLLGPVFDRELYNRMNDILEKSRSGR